MSALWIALLFVLLAFSRGQSQTVPALVNYQGRLANPDGSPLPTADYTLTFNLYDAATNGARVWGPQMFDGVAAQGHGAPIPVVQGWFNVMLGPVDTNGASLADAFNGTSRYVEVTVSNRPPIAPRQQILTTPFAFQAANSAKLAGYDWSALLGTNNPVAGTIPFSKLAQRQVGTNVGVGGIAASASSGPSYFINSTTDVAISNQTVTLATSGRPVAVQVVPDDGAPATSFLTHNGLSSAISVFSLYRGTNRVASQSFAWTTTSGSMGIYIPVSTLNFVDFSAAAGTNQYSVRASVSSGGMELYVAYIRTIAFEL